MNLWDGKHSDLNRMLFSKKFLAQNKGDFCNGMERAFQHAPISILPYIENPVLFPLRRFGILAIYEPQRAVSNPLVVLLDPKGL